jgi:hypothetical protein
MRQHHKRASPEAKSHERGKTMTEVFTGRSRSEQADRFIAKVEAEGGTVYDRWGC